MTDLTFQGLNHSTSWQLKIVTLISPWLIYLLPEKTCNWFFWGTTSCHFKFQSQFNQSLIVLICEVAANLAIKLGILHKCVAGGCIKVFQLQRQLGFSLCDDGGRVFLAGVYLLLLKVWPCCLCMNQSEMSKKNLIFVYGEVYITWVNCRCTKEIKIPADPGVRTNFS